MKITPRAIAFATLLVHWGPSNALSYGWGFLLFIFVLATKSVWFNSNGIFTRRITRYTIYFSIVFFLSAFVNLFKQDASYNNLFWSIFTYGSTLCTLIVFLSLPFREEDGASIFRFSLYLTFFQALVGYVQMLDASSFQTINPFGVLGPAAGDYFVGTTFDFGIGNQVAIKMSLTALLFIPFWFSERSGRNSIILILLLIGWILPSAIYTLIMGFLVIVLFFVVQGSFRSIFTLKIQPTIFYASLAGILIAGIFAYTQKENVGYMVESLKQVYTTVINKDIKQAARKVIYFRETITSLPLEYPYVPFIGVGPGNYSSRSAWLVSGEYLENQPSYIPVTPSKIAQDYNISLWSRKHISAEYLGGGSITNTPFSTWFSIFSEMGLLALLFMVMIMVTLYQSFGYTQRNAEDMFSRNLALGLKMALLYLVLLFFVDNLFEWPMVMAQFFVFAAVLLRRIENKMKETKSRIG